MRRENQRRRWQASRSRPGRSTGRHHPRADGATRGDLINARYPPRIPHRRQGRHRPPRRRLFRRRQSPEHRRPPLPGRGATAKITKPPKPSVEAAIYTFDAAIAEYYPSVSLNITGYLFRENFTDASKWTALLQVNLPIFSAGLIEADVRTAWSKLRQAALQESLIRRQIEQEVRTRHQNLLTSTSKLRELDAQIKAAAEAYRQAQAETRAGTGIFLNEITAQAVLSTAN